MKTSGLSLRKNILWNSSGSFVYLFCQWLVSYLIVVISGFKDAGIFSLCVAISSIAFTLALYGIRGYQVSDVTKTYSDKSYIDTRILTCFLAVCGCALYVVLYRYSPLTALSIVAYTLFKISEAYVDVYHGIIQRGKRMDIIGKSLMLRGVVSNALFVGTLILTKNLLLSISVLAASSFLLIFLYDRNKVRFFYEDASVASVKKTVNLLIECLPLAIYTFLSILVMSIPRISLESIKGTEVLGIYASIAIPAVVIQVLSGYIFAPMLTVFAEHVNQKNFKLFHDLLLKTIGYILALSVLVIIMGVLFGNFGLVLLFGDKISNYTYLFLPILFISSLTALSWFIGLMLTVIREFKGLIIASSVAAAICFFGSSTFIDHFSINGTSFVLILALVIQIGIMSVFMVAKLAKLRVQRPPAAT